jgi:hypothetical protein
MTIRFTCELTDPDTEALLNFLERLTGNNGDRMLEVIDCAKEWLKLDAPIPSHNGELHVSTSLVLVAQDYEDVPAVSSLSQMPSLQPPA